VQPRFFVYGSPGGRVEQLEDLCAAQLEGLASDAASASGSAARNVAGTWAFYPLAGRTTCQGLIGLPASGHAVDAPLLHKVLSIVGKAAGQLIERSKTERQLLHLNTYLNVSSLLAQALDLHESLEVALQCCMAEVSAEAGSVLLLDEEKKNFRFYNVEGPAKQVLLKATFPADKGLAGAILKSQQAEVINDVHSDSRFYGKIDKDSGFVTRNLIAIPLTAGEERIGVLEVLNKADGSDFTEEERLVLMSIAEEIAFAIRNARIFDYVVDSYCKQRQGQASCKGCKRPLGSWTPCVKYREVGV
jgi:hypothetical protein